MKGVSKLSVCEDIILITLQSRAAGHTLVRTVAKEATCTTEGNYEYWTCSVEGCGKVFKADKTTETTVAAETIAVNPDAHGWTEDYGYNEVHDDEQNLTGYTFYATRTCSFCNTEETATPTANCEESQKATCVATGVGTYTVTFDKEWADTQTYESRTTPINPKNHSNIKEYPANAPTCETAGNKAWSKCEKANGLGCGTTIVAYEEIAKTGHSASEAVTENVVAASCTVDGSHDVVVYCSVCKTHVMSRETVVDEAPGHTEVIDEAVAATFDAPGKTEGKHCDVCKVVLVAQQEIPQLVAVAQIGTQKYQTLDEAIEAANQSETPVTIVLLANFDKAPAKEVAAEITVNLNGNTINWVTDYTPVRALKAIAADGFTVKANEDGTYSFVKAAVSEPENGEAAIGNTVYATLADAIADAKDGAFINLKADVAEVPTGINKNLVIIPNGFKLADTEGNAALKLLQNSVETGYAVRTNYALFFINKQQNKLSRRICLILNCKWALLV